ncbi:Nance-Horan syndrome protein [Agrilus planipennis]|uniref:Wiskott-Aldrich syndrome protein family member n=1 Tax=Agrilus planipennis TaxID=224129 RepID=A0A1W4WEN8_AGRPL|nr:Nance-Horan syndrome protein [Agrilus planipennis]
MPFVQRVVEPKYVSRTSLFDEDGKPKISDGELDAVTNSTLSNALRQLASLVLAANDIFTELTKDLQKITERSHSLKTKIEKLDQKVATYDPKKVSVPESDISTFALLKNHYARRQQVDSNLFSVTTRPNAVQALYDAAAKTPVHVIRQMDRWRRNGTRSSRFFVCTPVLGQRRKKIKGKIDIEIETRMPAAVEELRRWTSTEALGDITVTPDCPNRIPQSVTYLSDGNVTDGTLVSDDDGIDHKLPSPEEQVQAIALKFPAEMVAVDISGRRFSRLSSQRRSVLYRSSGACTTTDAGVVDGASSSTATRRQTRSRRSRTRRRTTLAGTDEKEIKNALEAGEGQSTSTAAAPEEIVSYDIPPPFLRSKSSDILRSSVRRSMVTDSKKSHFQTLKEWGRNKFKLSSSSKSPTESRKNESNKENENVDSNVYETITVRKRRSLNREKRPSHERNPSYSSSEKSSVSIPIAKPLSSAVALAVRLRDTSSSQRRFRKSCDNKDEPRSSSGNWSASSESGRASIASEITTHPKSTTSAATSNNSLNLNHPPNSSNSTRKFASVSASDSVTSEGTLTPDIHDIHEDMDSSSVYSCDTEGYYTSFHMDSGLKTLKEEETPVMPFHTTSAFSTPGSPSDALSAESEYELFGKGSTSTTASSAGTVCTTLKAGDSDKSLFVGPSVPERKSSLSKGKDNVAESKEKNNTIKRSPASSKASVIAVIHKQTNGDISPDSGHNTSSSPTQSANSPNGGRSGSEFEYSECSDMEGADRIERIRSKTAINSSRIPSMCVITPPHSDDESVKSFWEKGPPEYIDNMPYISLNDLNAKNISSTTNNFSPNPSVTTGYVTLESLEGMRKPNEIPVSSLNTFRAPSPSGGSVTIKKDEEPKSSPVDPQAAQNQPPFIKASLLPLNVFGKLKLNIPNFSSKVDKNENKVDNNSNEYDEYVTIADIRNNNGKISKRPPVPSSDAYSDTISKKLNDVLTNRIRETEYVSLDELPSNPSPEKTHDSNTSPLEKRHQGARVTLDADGKVVYNSDSLKRKKSAHTTFQPGPFVKSPSETPEQSPLINRRTTPIRPVQQQGNTRPMPPSQYIIHAQSGMASPTITKEALRTPLSTVIAPPSARSMSPGKSTTNNRGAYVHMQKKPSESLTTKGQVLSTNIPTTSAPQQDVRTTTLPPRKSMNLYNAWSAHTDSLATLNYCDYSKFQTFPHRKPDHYRTVPKMPDISVSSKNPNPYEGLFETAAPNGRVICQDQNESLKISPIEPCKPQHMFQSSTPKPPESLKHAINLESKLLSPKKSTMSNEELYAVIHKSRKKLNILTDKEPAGAEEPVVPKEVPAKQLVKSPETGYLKDRSRERASWSPSEDQLDSYPGLSSSPRSRQSWAHSDKKGQIKQTSQMDFKRLLLQQSAKSNITSNNSRKLSAVEQLKLSKQQGPIQTNSSMNILDLSSSPRSLQRKLISTPPKSGVLDKPRSPAKLMSPRSQWRFASPRTDVLSSTILEDCREDESSGSSLEKKSRKNETEENSSRTDNNNISPKLSVSQYIRAKRAQFFSSTPKSDAENVSRFEKNASNNSNSPKDLPALETSF